MRDVAFWAVWAIAVVAVVTVVVQWHKNETEYKRGYHDGWEDAEDWMAEYHDADDGLKEVFVPATVTTARNSRLRKRFGFPTEKE